MLGGIAGLLGIAAEQQAARAATTPGGTIRVGLTVPAAAIDPVTIADNGGLELLIQTGEFLCVLRPDFTLRPVLAGSWTHNSNGSVWTFKLRSDVKFHSGGMMKAEDVIASIDRLCNPKNSSTRFPHSAAFFRTATPKRSMI